MVARIEFVAGGGKSESTQKKKGNRRNEKDISNIPDLYWYWNDRHLDLSFHNESNSRDQIRTNKNSDAYSSRSDNWYPIANFWVVISTKRAAT
jgi:hypothetical protein